MKKERIDPTEIDERYVANFKLTTFQKEAMKLIYEMRVIKTEQLVIIMRVTPNYANRQLGALYNAGFLYRRFESNSNKVAYWMLDRGGALFIAGAYEMSMKKLNWDMRSNLIEFDKLKHSLKITEVRTILEKAAQDAGHNIESCFCDRHLYYEFNSNDTKNILRPDMFIAYSDGNKIYQYFFEIDMGTMAVLGPSNRTSVFTSKIPKYEMFRQSSEWKNYFDVFPRVIFLTTTRNRAMYIADAVKNTQKTNMEFLISTFELLELDAFGEIYKKIGDGSAVDMFN